MVIIKHHGLDYITQCFRIIPPDIDNWYYALETDPEKAWSYLKTAQIEQLLSANPEMKLMVMTSIRHRCVALGPKVLDFTSYPLGRDHDMRLIVMDNNGAVQDIDETPTELRTLSRVTLQNGIYHIFFEHSAQMKIDHNLADNSLTLAINLWVA